tara:strand:+ start:96 stop:245 length:150 start_codon:yes stop_codon:yes gene_type:complete
LDEGEKSLDRQNIKKKSFKEEEKWEQRKSSSSTSPAASGLNLIDSDGDW